MSLLSRLKSLFKKKEVADSPVLADNHGDDEFYLTEAHRKCPYCGGRKDKFELLCYYKNDGILWSDFRHTLPQCAVASQIQKCPHCGKYYITKVSHIVFENTTDFEFIDPVSWEYFKQSYEAFTQLEKDEAVDYNHRVSMLCAFNDDFRRSPNSPIPTEQDFSIFKDNILHLLKYFQEAPILKAELYREAGMFDECFKQLEMVSDEADESGGSLKEFKETIFNFAKQQKTGPFGWDLGGE